MTVIEQGYIDDVIDSLQWDYRDQYVMRAFPHATNPNVFFILHYVIGTGIYVTSIQADDDGILTYLDQAFLFGGAGGAPGGIAHVDGDVYCAAFLIHWGGSYTNWIRTFTCDVNGNFTGMPDSFNFNAWGNPTNALFRPDIVKVPGGTKYAIVGTCGGNDGWLFTIDIDNAGNIAAAITDSWEFDTSYGYFPKIKNPSGNIFAIWYSRNAVEYLKTVSISAAGIIGAMIAFANTIGAPFQYGGGMILLEGQVWCFVWSTGVGWSQGAILFRSINGAGNIATLNTVVLLDFGQIQAPCVVATDDNLLGNGKILCIGTGSDAVPGQEYGLRTIEVPDDGSIYPYPSFIDSAIVDEDLILDWFSMIRIHDRLFLIIYRRGTGAPGSGYAETRIINGLVVSTQAPSDVESYGATLQGQLVYDEMQDCEVRFEYGKYPNFGYYTDWQSGFRMGDWFSDSVDLAPGVTYQFRAQGRSDSGITKGDTRVFTAVSIADSSPVVITNEATDIYTHQATLSGYISFDGFEACIGWLEYGLDKTYGMETPKHTGLRTGDSFSETVYNLADGQAYHCRAVIVDARGRKAYGQDKSFSTLSERGEMTGLDLTLAGLMES